MITLLIILGIILYLLIGVVVSAICQSFFESYDDFVNALIILFNPLALVFISCLGLVKLSEPLADRMDDWQIERKEKNQ